MEADPLTIALEHGYGIKAAVDKANELERSRACSSIKKGEEGRQREYTGEAIARRAKYLPSLILSAGLVPALTFYMSKTGGKEAYRNAFRVLRGDVDCDVLKKVGDDLGGGEGKGYAVVLAAVIDALSKLHPEALGGEAPQDLKVLAAKLKEMHENKLDITAEAVLQPYLVELKKVVEALLGGEGG